MDFERKEKLVIDTQSQYEERGNILQEWATERAVGEFLYVDEDEVWVDFLPEESGIDSDWTATGFTHKEYIINSLSSCKIHEVDKVYHDRREEWYCPFCKEGKINE